MKTLLSVLLLSTLATAASAAEVTAARYNAGTSTLEIDVVYGGGCKEHEFRLELGACAETFPVQCGADLKDLTEGDFCEALVPKTVSFTTKELGLNDDYFLGASITISGDNKSSATVRLPR